MRTCPNCGHMLSEKDTICFKCGMQLSQISSPGGNSGPMQAPPMMRAKGGQSGFPMNNGANKGGDNKSIYIVLGLIVVLAIVAVIIVFVSKNNKVEGDEDTGSDVVLKQEEPEPKPVEPDPEPEEPEPEPEEPEPPITTPEQPEQPTDPGSGHTTPIGGEVSVPEGYHLVSNNGYSYAVPDEYTAKDYGTQGFDILNYQKTKEMMISISLGTVANLKETLPAVRQMYIDSGAVVHNIKVTTISGIEAAPGEIFVGAVFAVKANDFNYDILAEGANIVKSAVKTAGGAVNTSADA